MKKNAKLLPLLLLTLFLSASKSEAQTLTPSQIRNIALAYDSLDECREITDSLTSQINNALQVVTASQALNDNLSLQLDKYSGIEKELGQQVKFEQGVSSSYRKEARIWKIVAFVGIGLTVYQIIK